MMPVDARTPTPAPHPALAQASHCLYLAPSRDFLTSFLHHSTFHALFTAQIEICMQASYGNFRLLLPHNYQGKLYSPLCQSMHYRSRRKVSQVSPDLKSVESIVQSKLLLQRIYTRDHRCRMFRLQDRIMNHFMISINKTLSTIVKLCKFDKRTSWRQIQ